MFQLLIILLKLLHRKVGPNEAFTSGMEDLGNQKMKRPLKLIGTIDITIKRIFKSLIAEDRLLPGIYLLFSVAYWTFGFYIYVF